MIRNGSLTQIPIIYDYGSRMEQLGNPIIGYSYKKQNQVTNLLAKEGAKKGSFEITQFLAILPVFANKAVWEDILETVFKRKINVCNVDTLSVNAATQGIPNSLMMF